MSFRVAPSAHFFGLCCCVEKMSLFEAGIVSFYYWDETGRMIFGVFGEAIDKFDVRVVGNHFALEVEAQPFAGHFRHEWCPYQFT